jgi:hypothetical protein
MKDDFGNRAYKVGAITLLASLGGAALLRRTNWGPGVRATVGVVGLAGVGILLGNKAPNVGLGLIASGIAVGGGFGMTALAQSGLLSPSAAQSTTSTTGTTTGTTNTAANAGTTGIQGNAAMLRGLGAGANVMRPDFRAPSMLGPQYVAGKR